MGITNKLLVILCVFTVVRASAQTSAEKKLTASVEALRVAMINADKATLLALTSPLLSYGHSSGHIDNQASFVEKLVTGASDFVTISMTEQTIAISGKTAIVRHLLKATTNDNGKPGEVQLRVLLVWQKQGGRWILLARQAVKTS